MRRAFNWLLLLLFVCGLLLAVSFAGARATAGKVVGSDPPLSERSDKTKQKLVERKIEIRETESQQSSVATWHSALEANNKCSWTKSFLWSILR